MSTSITQLLAPTQRLYLSIDLDFWNHRSLAECKKVLDYVRFRHKDVKIVDEHHDLIDHIDSVRPDTVINLDYHSDIANNEGKGTFSREFDEKENIPKAPLNCGTWANWIEKEFRQHFLWLYPSGAVMNDALCHYPQENEFNPFSKPSRADWDKVSKRAIRKFPYYLIDKAQGVGISISSDWLRCGKTNDIIKLAIEMFGKKRIKKALQYSDVNVDSVYFS